MSLTLHSVISGRTPGLFAAFARGRRLRGDRTLTPWGHLLIVPAIARQAARTERETGKQIPTKHTAQKKQRRRQRDRILETVKRSAEVAVLFSVDRYNRKELAKIERLLQYFIDYSAGGYQDAGTNRPAISLKFGEGTERRVISYDPFSSKWRRCRANQDSKNDGCFGDSVNLAFQLFLEAVDRGVDEKGRYVIQFDYQSYGETLSRFLVSDNVRRLFLACIAIAARRIMEQNKSRVDTTSDATTAEDVAGFKSARMKAKLKEELEHLSGDQLYVAESLYKDFHPTQIAESMGVSQYRVREIMKDIKAGYKSRNK